MNDYGIQLYSLRDVAEADLKKALRLVSEMGYAGVEFAGFFGHSAEEVASWLKEYNLMAVGTHTGMDEIEPDRIDETIAYHMAIGCKNLILPCGSFRTEEGFDHSIELMKEAYPKLKAAGIELGYHNHSLEYFAAPCGRVPMDEIIEKTEVSLEVDTFWAYNADLPVVDYLEAHKSRIRLIHLKDGIVNHGLECSFEGWLRDAKGVSVGAGELPITDIVNWAEKNGVYVIVESEGLDPTGPDEVRRCIDFLKAL